jgi:hypothetical protein
VPFRLSYRFDAEDGVPVGFGCECVEGGVWCYVEERPYDLDLAEVLPKDRGALLGADFADLDRFLVSPSAQGDLTSGAGILNPAYVAVGRNQPTLVILDQDEREWCCKRSG